MSTMIHGVQLEAAYQWFQANASDEARANLSNRERWFAAMKRINCSICDGPVS